MLKVERSTDYLKGASLEITEPIEEEQNTQQSSKSFQPKPRIRRQYSPNDNNLQLLSLIARYKQDPALISDIKGLLNKVDINYRDKDGDTFLHAAIQEEHQDVVKLILEKGARIDIENNAGKTPLSLANELDNRNPNKQSIIQMLDQSRQKDDKRKRKQPPSDPNKRQKFDQDNSFQFAEKTLNQQDYQVWLTQEDIANIARIKYGWYGENSNVLFEVIGSVGQLDVELKRHKEIPKAPSKQSLIFIINLNSNHWVTLVIIHQNQQFSAYYINSFGDEITSDIRDKLNSAMPGIQISNPKFKQQEDGYNCGIFALENARIINDKIKSGKTNLEIEQALKGYELTSDDLKNKRKEFAEELQQQKAKLNYEGSTLNDSSAKKSSSTEIQKPKAVKRPNNDQEVPNKKVKPSSQKYSKSGLVYTLHGDIYQLKLLMLFVKRGLDRGYLFELATEMDIAEKFDDLVFQYKKNNADRTEEKVGRFLQAKHKQDEDKRISVNDLLTEKNGEFSLQKYFISYRKIQQNLEFKNSNLQYKDFIICTNIGFKFGDKRSNLELSEDIFDHETDENEILNTKLFQFKDEFTGREEIFSVLRSAPDLTKLAKGLAECVLDGKSINDDKSKDDPEGNLFKSYQSALIDKVIDKESYKLSVDFVKGQQLSSGAENLRAAFKKVFDDRRKSFNLDDKPIIKDPENFAQEIAKLIESQLNKVVKVEKRKHVIKDNFDKLAGYVLIKKDNKIKFSTAFLNDHELPGNLNIFRKKLQSELPKLNLDQCEFKTYKDFKTCEEIYVDKDNFWEKIKEKELKLFKDFGKLDTNLQSTEKFVEKFISLLEESESKENLVVKIKRADKIINKDIDKLAQHVLIEKEDEIRFSSEFLSDTQLPGNLNDFRSQLKAKLKELNFDLNVLKEYKFYISNFPKFNLPNDSIKEIEENIKDFLKKLRFAVNQPNEDKLGEMIKDELGKEFNTIDKKNVYGRFLEKMLDWMKDKKGKFFSHEEGKTFFEGIRKEILGTIWFNLKDPVTLFTGRKRELSDLHKALQRNQGKDKFTVISQMTSISGLGGMGKSELARKYAYDHENDYDGNVIWINAENYGTLEDSFLNLARDNRLGIPKKDRDGKEKTVEATVKEIYVFFAKRKSLFIFDNAEKNDDLSKFLPLHDLPPNANKPYVLITSRNREWEKVIEVIDLSELKLEDAIEFVKKGLGISEEDESQDQEIKNLVEKLQRFPLAIQQAIAYIEDQRVTGEFSIDDYLEEYKEKTEDLLNSEVFNGIDNGYAKTTCTTWKITIDKIASDKEHGELALEVLNTIAYFAAENINREIFLGLAGGDEVKLKSGVRLLVKYSMVNGEQKQSLLSIHRLVQQVTRINVKDREKEILRKALGLLRDNINKYGVDHPMSVWSYASSHNELVKEFSSLPRMVIDELYYNMKYSKASSFEEEALKSLEKVLGDKHPEFLIMKRYRANAYGDSGNYEEKRRLLEDEVLPILRQSYQELPIEIARTLRNLGVVYGDLSDHEKEKDKKNKLLESRKKYLEEARKIFEECLGNDSIEVAKVKRNLANAYGDSGNYEEKRKLLEDEVLPVFKEYYGYDHLEVAKAKRNLANAYGDLNRYEKKRKLLEDEVLPILEKYYESDHVEAEVEIEFAKAKRNLGNVYRKGDEVLAEECLSGSSYRRKREAESECLFTWEDVDKFNTEKDEKRDFDKVNINSEKFVSYIKDLPEGKRSQLIQLADKVKVIGESQSLVNKLISNQKVISHLSKVGKISGMTMHGMMAKNVLADFLNGDYQGVAINVGFIAGGQGFAKVAQAASMKGLEIASEGKLLLGRSLGAASPFLARGTSAFVVYDLVNQVKAFKNGTEEALVGVVGDSIYLGVDAAEIGIEIAEAFEVLEGVSSVTGPIGATIGAVVFVGTDIYMAVKRVDKIDQIIHLTGNEKFIEGLRAFIGMKPEQYIEELMEKKQLYNQLVKQGLEYLKGHSDIQSYVFPTGKSVVDSCRDVPYQKSICSGGFNWCSARRTVTRYTEKCTTKFEVDLDSTVLLDRKRTDIRWSRARPDNPSNGKLFCLPKGNDKPAPSYGSYLCENAIGLSANKTGSHTLISLGEGKDYAKGFLNNPNIFVVNNGSKKYFGGNKDDIFILQGSSITGYFYGEGGVNTLDLTSFAPEEGSIDVKLHIGQVEDYYRKNFFGMSGINKFLGRKAKADQVFITCNSDTSDIKFVDGQSGSEGFVDHINIHDENCAYEMQIVVRPNTVIYNRALKGDFHYIVPYALGSAKVDFIYTAEALNLNNTFAFEYEPVQIKNVDVRNINILNKTSHIITFNFSPMSDKEFNITISGASNPSYRLGNNTEIKVGNKGNLYMLENTNKSVDEIIKNYLVVANRLNRMSFFIQSLLSNETVAIGSGNYEVIHNNPLQKSHLVGNGGENVYVIDSKRFEIPLPEVVIYDLDIESSVDTIDLRNLVQQTRGEFSNSFKLQILKSANDLLLKATVEKPIGDSSISEKHEYFTVRLKDGVSWYNKTHVIMDNVPMRISLDNNEWSLKPQSLIFEKDKEVIVITDQDVEKGTELITSRKGGNYTFVRSNSNDLMVTNAFDSSITKNDLCSITLSKFYETPKMKTLSIKFADQEIVLKDHEKEISAARDVNIVKGEYKDQVYSDVFNRSPEVMLSDQPHRHQIRHRRSTSGSARTSSWINDLFGWVKSSIGGLLSSALSKEISSTPSSISQVDAPVDVNGTIMLLDVLIRKVTGQKYISTADQHVSLLEAQGYALNITEKFEKVVEQAALKSGISMHRLNIDFVKIQKEVTGKIMSGKFNEISGILNSYVEKACPAGQLSLKKFDKFMATFNNKLDIALNQPIQQMLHNGNNVSKMGNIKEPQSLGLSGPRTRLDDVLIAGNSRELVAGRRQ